MPILRITTIQSRKSAVPGSGLPLFSALAYSSQPISDSLLLSGYSDLVLEKPLHLRLSVVLWNLFLIFDRSYPLFQHLSSVLESVGRLPSSSSDSMGQSSSSKTTTSCRRSWARHSTSPLSWFSWSCSPEHHSEVLLGSFSLYQSPELLVWSMVNISTESAQ